MGDVKGGNAKKKEKKVISLKWGYISVLLCWTVPMLCLLGVLLYYTTFQLQEQIDATVKTSVYGIIDANNEKLKAVMDDSRAISYYSVVADANAAFLENGDAVALNYTVTDYLEQQYSNNNDIATTFLFYTARPNTVYAANFSQSDVYVPLSTYKASIHEEVQSLSQNLGTRFAFISGGGSVYMVRNIVNESFEPYAVIVSRLNTHNLFKSLDSVVWIEKASVELEGNDVMIIGEDPIETSLPSYSGKSFEVVEQSFSRAIYKMFEQVYGYEVNYVIQVNTSALSGTFTGFSISTLIIVVLTVLILLVSAYFIYRNITEPVNSLVAVSEKIENGELGSVVDSETTISELRYLVERFNDMSLSMKKQFDQSYLEQLALQDARTKALQSQINPHFLNNTLEIINWEARLGGNLSVSKMIEALSTILGAATARGGKNIVHLSEEMMFVDAYFYIISVRMGKRLEVKREIDDSLLDCDVPILILQPIIENAVEHGIGNKQKGIITMRVYKKDEALILEVENNGALSEEDKATIEQLLKWDGESESEKTKSGQLGMRNVNHRIKIMYGENYGLTVESCGKRDELTVARLTLPIKKTNKRLS